MPGRSKTGPAASGVGPFLAATEALQDQPANYASRRQKDPQAAAFSEGVRCFCCKVEVSLKLVANSRNEIQERVVSTDLVCREACSHSSSSAGSSPIDAVPLQA